MGLNNGMDNPSSFTDFAALESNGWQATNEYNQGFDALALQDMLDYEHWGHEEDFVRWAFEVGAFFPSLLVKIFPRVKP